MKKLISFLFIFFVPVTFIFAQLPEKVEKKREKARAKYEDGKYEDARKILKGLVEDYPWGGSLWDLLCQVEYADYYAKKSQDKLFNNMSITVKKDGKETTDDSLATRLMALLKEASPSRVQYKAFMNTCREATLKCGTAENTSILIRALLIDERVDTLVEPEAVEAFQQAEVQFGKNNFAEAIKYYKKASSLDSTFYKARLYLGDAYYNNKEYAEATKYFKEAVKVKPTLSEPRKYLTDALINLGEYEHAQKECIGALLLYPDIGMFLKLEYIAEGRGKKFDRKWMPRAVYPDFKSEQTYDGKENEWKVYLEALKEIKSYCNDKGVIIKSNDLTTTKYAEVYAWEKMLKSTSAEKFATAKKMQTAGYLDCYVLFSLYHIDLQQQFRSLVNTNSVHVENYIDMLISM